MKKTVIPIVLLIIVTVLSIPFASGLIMERSYQNSIENINKYYKDSGIDSTIEIINYDRHYLTSDIEWKIDLGVFKSLYQIEEIVFKDHAKHGFNGVVSTTSLQNNPWYADFVAKNLNGKDPIHISTKYGLLGEIESTLKLEPFVLMAEGEKIDVKEGELVVTTNRKFEDFKTSGSWQGLLGGEKLAFGKCLLESDLKKFSPHIWDGDIHFEVERINLQDKNEQIELEDMKGRYRLKVNKDQTATSWNTKFSIGGISTPKMSIDNASIHSAIKGINIEGYQAFMEMYMKNFSHLLGSMTALSKNAKPNEEVLKKQMATMGLQMMGAYEKLLKKGLEIKISDLTVELADGEINGGITVKLLKDMTLMQFAPLISQPELLFDIIYLKSDLSLPVNLVGEDPKLLTPVYPGMQTGLFVKRGDSLAHEAETVDGKLIINDKAVILPGQNK